MPNERKTVKLGDILSVEHGYAFESDYFVEDGEYIVLTPGNFYEKGGFKHKEEEKWYDGPIPEGYILDRNELLVAMTEQKRGLLGSAILVPDSDLYLHNQRLGLITDVDEAVSSHYLYYLFNHHTVRSQIAATANGAKVRHTSPDRIAEVEVELPSLETQNKIVEILSRYDQLIENIQKRVDILEEMVKLLYYKWFVQFNAPGCENIDLKSSSMGKIPEDWEVMKFTDIADVLTGGTPSTKEDEYWNGDIPFFTPRESHGGYFVFETEKNTNDTGIENSSTELYPPRTVFITARGTVGELALPAVPMALNQSCYALSGNAPVSQEFLFLLIQERIDYLKKNTGGATFDTIIIDTFRRMDVLVPSEELIIEFNELIEPYFDLLRTLGKKERILEQKRDILMPQLISGEIKVSDVGVKEATIQP